MLYLILLSLFLISQLLTPTVFAQTDPSGQARDTLFLDELACQAKDPAGVKKCIEEVKNTKIPLVKITAPIICKSPLECNFEIKNIKTDTIFFAAKSEFAIIRENDFSYPVFTIEGSSGIRFYEMNFEDRGQGGCPLGTLCPTMLSIKSSDNIQIDRSEFLNIRGNAASVSDSRHISVVNSSFLNGFKTGLEVPLRYRLKVYSLKIILS